MVGAANVYFLVFEQNRGVLDTMAVIPKENVVAIQTGSLPAKRRGAHAETSAALLPHVLAALKAGDTVLVKGSNGSKMSLIVDALKASGVLQSGHTYRLQYMAHDGDQNKTGGDAGQSCVNVAIP